MTFRNWIIIPTALLALAACGRSNDANQADTMTTADVGTDRGTGMVPVAASGAQNFANVAAASDAFEIETSKLALTNGATAAVKTYANKMIEAHTASTAKLKSAAAGVTPTIDPRVRTR